MNSTVLIVFSVFGAAMVLLNLYGAFTADRKLFLSGLCFFSLLPIIGESMAYNADMMSVHVIMATMFLAQFILAFPNKVDMGSYAGASQLITKVSLALLIFNIGGCVYIFCLKAGVPHRFGYCHLAFSLSILYVMFRRMGGKAFWVK